MVNFDSGSELSDIESNGSPPPTPGNAPTPQTSPKHRARESSLDPPMASSSSDRKVAGPSKERSSNKKARSKRKSDDFENEEGSAIKSRKKRSRMEKDDMNTKEEIQSPMELNVDGKSTVATQPETTAMIPVATVKKAGTTRKKSTSMRGWAYVPEEEYKKLNDEAPVDGKRTRKPTAPYIIGQDKPPKRGKDSVSRDAIPSPTVKASLATEEEDEFKEEKKPKLTIRLNIDTKKKEKAADKRMIANDARSPSADVREESEDLSDISDPPVMEDGDDAYEEEEEEGVFRPDLKRKRDVQVETKMASNVRDDDDEEEDTGPKRPKKSTSVIKKSKKKFKDRQKEKKRSRKSYADYSDDHSASEVEKSKTNQNNVISDDTADDEGFDSDVKTGSRGDIKIAPSNRKVEGTNSSSMKKMEPRRSNGSSSAASKNTVAGLINAYTKSAPSITTPKPVIAKAAVRKVPSMNLFDNIMGFGGGSKQSTPVKGSALKSARSSLSGVNTPQGNSPMVRPAGTASTKKSNETSAGESTPATSRLSLGSIGRASPMPSSNGNNGRMVTVDVRGANGEHVTAAEMARRREIELYANAHPKGVFNLLEGAEIMMQFEDDTRRLLEFDPLIARTKLYRASRTEGLPKLIERIKMDEKRKREAMQANSELVEVTI